MDLSKALDKIMSLPTDKAKEYANAYVAQLREVDAVAMPTSPDAVRAAVFNAVKRLPSEPVEEDEPTLEDAGLHTDRECDGESIDADCGDD